jgi:hypothetical protein
MGKAVAEALLQGSDLPNVKTPKEPDRKFRSTYRVILFFSHVAKGSAAGD